MHSLELEMPGCGSGSCKNGSETLIYKTTLIYLLLTVRSPSAVFVDRAVSCPFVNCTSLSFSNVRYALMFEPIPFRSCEPVPLTLILVCRNSIGGEGDAKKDKFLTGKQF
jgi:hypothetical protein